MKKSIFLNNLGLLFSAREKTRTSKITRIRSRSVAKNSGLGGGGHESGHFLFHQHGRGIKESNASSSS